MDRLSIQRSFRPAAQQALFLGFRAYRTPERLLRFRVASAPVAAPRLFPGPSLRRQGPKLLAVGATRQRPSYTLTGLLQRAIPMLTNSFFGLWVARKTLKYCVLLDPRRTRTHHGQSDERWRGRRRRRRGGWSASRHRTAPSEARTCRTVPVTPPPASSPDRSTRAGPAGAWTMGVCEVVNARRPMGSRCFLTVALRGGLRVTMHHDGPVAAAAA